MKEVKENIENMLNAIKDSNDEAFADSFKAAMSAKIEVALNERKKEIASQLFSSE